jgi:RND family efflux transporter MFP subunit
VNLQNPKPDWAMKKREKARAEATAAGEKPKRRKWPWIVLLLLIAAAGGGYYYAQENGLLPEPPMPVAEEEPEAPSEPITRLAAFEVETVEPRTLTDTLRVTGSLTPARQVHLSAEVSARLVDVNVRAGDAVSEGETLAQFDVAALTNQLAQAQSNAEATRAQVSQAQTDFERTQTLVERDLAAPNALDQARTCSSPVRAQLAAQETAVETARTALEKATVTAPFDGVIAERQVDAGAFVGTGSPLFTIVDLASLEFEATVPVSRSAEIAAGQRVALKVEGFGDRIFDGEVERISPMAIEGSRMLPVFVTLGNPGGQLRGGMFASGQIALDRKEDALSVPVAALRRDSNGAYVLAIDGDRLERVNVEPVREWADGTRIEIADDALEGRTIVAAGLSQLRDGQKINLAE